MVAWRVSCCVHSRKKDTLRKLWKYLACDTLGCVQFAAIPMRPRRHARLDTLKARQEPYDGSSTHDH
jgi:hypothetical protein